jgi:hypothetical protein
VLEALVPELELVQRFLVELALHAERLEDRDGRVLALDTHHVDFAEHDVRDQLPGLVADQHAEIVLLGETFEARAEVHRVAHDGIGLAQLRAHVADAHASRVDADPDLELRPALSPGTPRSAPPRASAC